jgi:hypothetical protein
MYKCVKEDCNCAVEEEFTYCSQECQEGNNCGCEGCDCGSEDS